MSFQETDLTFFTNDENQTLLDRFKATLADTRLFDILVGYFHACGFYQLYDLIQCIEKTRILVELGINDEIYRALHPSGQQMEIDFESHANAKKQFEELWRQSVDISEEFIDTVKNKTWLNDAITPYELYLKLIYEYMQEDINLQDDVEVFLPRGFMSLKYQNQAVVQALKKLDEHKGVFLSDVVGLGKTFKLLLEPLTDNIRDEKNSPSSSNSLTASTIPVTRCATTWKPWTVLAWFTPSGRRCKNDC